MREKGCADFLALAEALAGQADFVHVGPTEHDQSDALSDEEVAAAAEAGTVEFIGDVPDVRPYLASATIVVLPPPYREGVPRAVMEAVGHGPPRWRPTTSGACARWWIRGLGLLVPRGDLPALTAPWSLGS